MEICGSLDNALPLEAIVELVGEDKVIFGTDAINLDPKYELGKVAFAPLSDETKKKIFAGNYLKLLETSQMGKIAF
jgi:predicted TIM-barrel fold metal-dependent hydrolase